MTKQNNSIDLFETLSSTYNEYLSSQEEEQKLYKKMNEEIAELERKIKYSYQKEIDLSKKNCTVLKQELENCRRLLANYSTFDCKLIGSIIEKLVTFVEGEEYSCQEANHETYEYESTVFGRESFKVNKKILMIVKGSQKHGYYYDYNNQNNEVDKLVENGQAFVLVKDKYSHNKNITFYTTYNGRPKCLIDFNRFSYVKDFIDLVVEYRYKNHLDSVSEKELLSLMSEFILSKKTMIEDNHRKRALEKQEQLKQQFIEKQEQLRQQFVEEQLRHNSEIEQIEFENLLQNGVPSRYNDTVIDRLRKLANDSDDFNSAMSQFEISYEGEKHIAKITYDEPIISSENIFISKINIESSIKDYFDDSDPDPHFHGDCDIDLIDDGLVGIVDISNSNQDLSDIINFSFPYGLYKVDKIEDEYLRVLYLPNRGEYRHRPSNVYPWIMEGTLDKQEKDLTDLATSYKTEWDSRKESEKMLICLKEVELTSHLTEKQLQLYKQRKK